MECVLQGRPLLTPMDATGALTGAGHTTHLLDLRRTTWAGAGPSASGHGCTHAFTGTVAELWSWPRTDDAALPGAAPRLLDAADADHGFHGGPLGAPLRKRHVELGPNVHGGSQAMQPGSWLFAAIVAGGRLLIAGPGEQLEIHATQLLWARIHLPEASAVRVAEYGCAPGVQVLLEGATGGAWMWERPPRCPRGAVTAAPVVPHAAPPAARPLDPRLEGADLGLRAWLSAQARRGGRIWYHGATANGPR